MTRLILLAAGAYFLSNAVVLWAVPQLWYDSTPGVAQTGGYNVHFIRDVALAFAVSAAALFTALHSANRQLALFGVGFPVLHAVFHIWIWAVHRGAAFDLIALVNLGGIQLPAWLALIAAFSVGQEGATA